MIKVGGGVRLGTELFCIIVKVLLSLKNCFIIEAAKVLIKFLTLQVCSFWSCFNFDSRYSYSTTNTLLVYCMSSSIPEY